MQEVESIPRPRLASNRKTTHKTNKQPTTNQNFNMQIKTIQSYSVNEVCVWVNSIGLGDKASAFSENGVDGEMLLSLTADEMKEELGLTSLQVKKVSRWIDFTKGVEKKYSEDTDSASSSDRVKELEAQVAKLQKENKELKAKTEAETKPAPSSCHQTQAAAPQGRPVIIVNDGRRLGRRHRLL